MNDFPSSQGDNHEPEETAPLGSTEETTPLGNPTYGAPTMPPPGYAPTQPFPTYGFGQPAPAAPSAPSPEARKRGLGFATGVVAAALVVGGAAGVGGAAIYHSNDNGTAKITIASPTSSSNVATTDPTAPDGSVEKVAADVLPSVVKIEVEGSTEAGSGSGIILDANGDIVTNNHVVAIAGSSGKIRVDFNDGSTAPATIVGTDPVTDTAVIKVSDVGGLTPATIGSSGSLKVGQNVVAIGSPFGLDSTVTSGIVSALNRPVDVSQDANTAVVYPAIQTDAAINPGNSGGALVNLSGQVVGINASIRSTSDSSDGSSQAGSIGLGFAIPLDEVMPVIQQMIAGQTPTHARLGVSVPSSSGDQNLFQPNGATVSQVTAGGAADKAGLKKGDIVTKVGNELITDGDSLIATVRSYRPGDTVTVTWTRNGKTMSASVKLDSDAATSSS
jgi:putative serine protease PepD